MRNLFRHRLTPLWLIGVTHFAGSACLSFGVHYNILSPGHVTGFQISRLFYGHVNSERIGAALEQLAAFGALAAYSEQTGGRSSTFWLAVQQ
jgi:hypothetical protein